MPSKLKTGLTMANPNDFVLVEKNINDNLIKIDDDVDATWGGEYGGYIQDTSVAKVVGKRYIDRFDKKAYECLVPSHENTITNYQACNVKDNLSRLNNLVVSSGTNFIKFSNGILHCWGESTPTSNRTINLPQEYKDSSYDLRLIANTPGEEVVTLNYGNMAKKYFEYYANRNNFSKLKWSTLGWWK